MNAESSILIVGFVACAVLIGVGMFRRNWNVLMIGVMLLAVAAWTTVSTFKNSN